MAVLFLKSENDCEPKFFFMLAKTDVARIYETVLSIPGMNDNIKITLTISRKNILLLSKVVERGLTVKEPDEKSNNVLDIVPKENLQELLLLAADMLDKAGLTEMNQKLQSL